MGMKMIIENKECEQQYYRISPSLVFRKESIDHRNIYTNQKQPEPHRDFAFYDHIPFPPFFLFDHVYIINFLNERATGDSCYMVLCT